MRGCVIFSEPVPLRTCATIMRAAGLRSRNSSAEMLAKALGSAGTLAGYRTDPHPLPIALVRSQRERVTAAAHPFGSCGRCCRSRGRLEQIARTTTSRHQSGAFSSKRHVALDSAGRVGRRKADSEPMVRQMNRRRERTSASVNRREQQGGSL